jgi:methyl-accepting chemotaxis protein
MANSTPPPIASPFTAATKEIASNVAQASQGIHEVNVNVNQSSSVSSEISKEVADIGVSMNEMSTCSSQVNPSAQELSILSENLKRMADQFKV